MNCPITLENLPGTIVSFRADHTCGKDFASAVPIVVIKKLLGKSMKVHLQRMKNVATLVMHYPFLGVYTHVRRIYFFKSELIDPFTWKVEDPEQFLQELLDERDLLQKVAFAVA